jgi:transcriptional regulator with XRE-family HTH domain
MINGSQIRAARGLLNWTQDHLAEASKVGRRTIQLIENDFPARTSNIIKLHETLMGYGVDFLHRSGVQLRSKGLKDFTGPESCDEFFDHALKAIEEKGGDFICLIRDQEMLVKATGAARRTNIERLEQVQKVTTVKCLVTEKIKPTFPQPTFEIRMLPEEPFMVDLSTFAFSNQWVGGFLDDDKTNFNFAIFEKISFTQSCQNYFLPRWQMAKPLLEPAKIRPSRSS